MRRSLRIVAIVLGALFILVGATWVLQGVNVLTRSVMSGQNQWTIIGAIVGVVGVAVVLLAALLRRQKPGAPA